jgi:hypothetical protein
VAVVYIRYVKDDASPEVAYKINPIFNDIEPWLRDCASSPDYFLMADSPAQIVNAFEKVANTIKAEGVRITH